MKEHLLLPENNIDRIIKLCEDVHLVHKIHDWLITLDTFQGVKKVVACCSPTLWAAFKLHKVKKSRELNLLRHARVLFTKQWIKTNPFKVKKEKDETNDSKSSEKSI